MRLEPDNARRISASMQVRIPFCSRLDDKLLCLFYVCNYLFDVIFQISDFNSAKADFGTDLALSTRTELNPGKFYE